MKKLLKKVQLFHIVIILVIVIPIVFIIYQKASVRPKEIKIENTEQSERLPEEDFSIKDISEKTKLITCAIDVSKLPKEEFFNYVSGKGTGTKINCCIVLKIKDRYYKLKTILQESAITVTEGKINFEAVVKSKYLGENCEILLYDNENKKVYQYIGGKSEENN